MQTVTSKHVGSTPDAVAFDSSSILKELNESLIFPFHWNGDNAYTLSQCMMTPIPGNVDLILESFNFYHSQLRITIERTFGIFIRRWGIFWRALDYELCFICEIIQACCRLHNFCMDNGVPMIHEIPRIAEVNEEGVLTDPIWRAVREGFNAPRNGNGNVLRDSIIEEIQRDEALQRTRNYRH